MRLVALRLALGSAALLALPAAAQTAPPPAPAAADTLAAPLPPDTLALPPRGTLDVRAFRYVYAAEAPTFVAPIRQVNRASVPLFAVAVPVSALATASAGADWDPTVRLAASGVGAVGVVYAVKNLVRRPRPYDGLDGVEARVYVPENDPDPHSFPSGHAALSFALATSTSLSYPRWYVVAPAMTWASATALARVWHGVHYPSDILAGAALGAGAATLVHLLLPEIDDDGTGGADAPPALTLRLSL